MTLIRLALVTTLLATRTAHADPYDDAYSSGERHFDAKEFAPARADFEKAFSIRADPILLYEIAQTYRFESKAEEAIRWYKRYLAESAPSESFRRNALDYIAGLEATLAAKKQPATPPPPATQVVRHRHIPLGSKIAAGVAGAGLVTTLVFTKIGLTAEHDLHHDPDATQADADRVERDQDLINLSLGLTCAAAATAVVLYFAAPSYTTERRTIVVGPMHDGGWAASIGGRF